MAATLPGQTAGLSRFIDTFIEDLGLSRLAVSWLYTGATVLGPLGLPLAALLYRDAPERHGLAPDEAAPRRKIVYGLEEVYRRRGRRRPDRS